MIFYRRKIIQQIKPCDKCLTFTSDLDQKISINKNYDDINLQYSFDKKTWYKLDTTKISFGGDIGNIYVRGYNPKGISKNINRYINFVFDNKNNSVSCTGNIMYLLDYTQDKATIPCSYCFYRLFYSCTSLTTAPALPATELSPYCYEGMFEGCTGLMTAPVLPATILNEYCYENMFKDCNNLNYIKYLALYFDETCTTGWVYNVSGIGTFEKYDELEEIRGDSYIPQNWVVNDIPTPV